MRIKKELLYLQKNFTNQTNMTHQELINMFVNEYSMDKQDAQNLACRNIELSAKLKNGVVQFSYKKNDGTTRVAKGTLVENAMPIVKGTGRPTAPILFLYYDVEKLSFRSFKRINLLKTEGYENYN